MKTFILNDETRVNSYGFRVRNLGGDFSRFDANPVMLDSHENKTDKVLGNWLNRRVDGHLIKADSNFDLSKSNAKDVKGQVDRGFIKACSMCVAPLTWDENSWYKASDGILELVRWELMEVSICAVPSNSSALALYNNVTGRQLTAGEFKLNLSGISGLPLTRLNMRPGDYSWVTSPDDFQLLSDTDKLAFKTKHYQAYLALFNQTGGKAVADKPLLSSYSHVNNVDEFMRLSDADKMNFKTNHNQAYISLFARY